MELCDSSLDKFFPRDPTKFDVLSSTFTLLHQLSQGLEYIHSKKLVHRDIKPENALIKLGTPLPVVKWADFGLSKSVKSELGSFTQSGVRGPRNWMAPETLVWLQELRDNFNNETAHRELLNQRGNYSSDVFSTGCFFFYIVTHGVHPFGGNWNEQILNIKEYIPVNLDGTWSTYYY
jgi:serine/threonine protein kinase